MGFTEGRFNGQDVVSVVPLAANPMRDNVAYVNSLPIHIMLSRKATAKPSTVVSPTFGLPW